MTNQPQKPNPIQDNYYPDDEIELIDYLRVLWKWKWLIIMGTFLCALVAFIYGFTHPVVKMYEVSTFVEIDPKVADSLNPKVADSLNPNLTNSLDKIKLSIELGIFNAQIMKDLSSSGAAQKIEPLSFEVSIPDNLNMLHIVYKTPYPDEGKAVSGLLVKQIEGAYKERIEQVMSEIDDFVKTKERDIKDIKDSIILAEKKSEKDIAIKKNRIQSCAAKIKALKENIGYIENTMAYMKKALQQAESNAEKLVPKIEAALVDPQDSTDHGNIDIQGSAIQQLINHPITLRSQIDSLAWEKEKFLVEILSEENKIEELKAEIELMKAKINISAGERKITELKSEIESLKRNRDHITAIHLKQNPTVSPLPIKSKIKQKVLLAGVVGLFFFVFLAFFIEYIKNASKSSPANKET
ncbi:MAG: hypothetical protein KKA75_06840 [Proteobacteria bacterium]|nr:hypothetical protein [Pseudomonadota bacterium]